MRIENLRCEKIETRSRAVAEVVWEDNTFIRNVAGVTGASNDGAYVNFTTGSGKYRFSLKQFI